jgi:hypothetical protein
VVPFHYDPGHTDAELDRRFAEARAGAGAITLEPGTEGSSFEL